MAGKSASVRDFAPARLSRPATVDYLGNDNVVYSTDYPHGDPRYPHASESFMELPLSDEERHKILWDNCAQLYQVGVPVS